MSVYVIRRSGNTSGLVKIGFAADVDQRIAAMLTAAPEGIDVIYALEGDRNLERTLHQHFAAKRAKREWFSLTDEELQSIPQIKANIEKEYKQRQLPTPADEFSDNIILETRFYLNELMKREWRGIGDPFSDVADRVMDSCELDRSYGFRLLQKYQEMKDVSGEAYRCLRLAYAIKLREEGELNDNQGSFLRTMVRTYRNNPSLREVKGFGVQYILDMIEEEAALPA
jgi:hypothetical protein